MKKIYIAGRFEFDSTGSLKNDIRSILLGGEKYLLNNMKKTVKIFGDEYLYVGPFFNEKAAEHDMTANFGKIVVATEKMAIEQSDLFIAIFDNSVSPGTAVELTYALTKHKDVVVLYLENENKSENWFAITFAEHFGATVIPFNNEKTLKLDIIKVLNS